MNRFILNRSLLVIAISILFANAICSQINSVNLTTTGELLDITLKTRNGLIIIENDFRSTTRQDGNHSVDYQDGKIRRIDNFYFHYSNGKIRRINNEYFRYSGSYGKLSELAGLAFRYHASGREKGKLEKINNHYLYYSNGILSNESCFTERGIMFRVFNSSRAYYRGAPNDYPPRPGVPHSYSNVNPSNSASESLALAMLNYDYEYKSNYYRVKKERPVFKFMGDKCFKISKDGQSLSATPVDCNSYEGNYKTIRDEIFVLRFDDKVCFKGELVDGESLIFQQRKCPKGKERFRLNYH